MSGTYPALGFDPAPGEVGPGRDMARTLRDVTHALGEVAHLVRGDGQAQWVGKAADAYRDLMSADFAPRITEAHEAFSTASRALDHWVESLDGYQSRARALEREAEEARRRLDAASASLDGLGAKPTGDADAQARDHWQDRHQALSAARGARQDELEQVLARARSLAEEVTHSAVTAAGALDTAMKAAPDEPGFWDKLKDVVEDVTTFLGDVIEFVKDNWWDILHKIVAVAAIVLAIAALFVPGAGWLVTAALLASVLDTGMSGIDALMGRPGAKEAFLTGLVGLGAGAALGAVVRAATPTMKAALETGPFAMAIQGGVASIARPTTVALSVNDLFVPALGGFMALRMKDSKDATDGILSLLGGHTYYDDKLADGWRKARDDD
ncbi:putative T7SS-secreted protein [Nocardioides marmoribigeumensis]|uniref:Uncharacterized protein YukE n=1 Tax=Nocardioides marmoribigeumensis TaxID=433649 RepID=A0ABU2BWS7_9ACTN|nr:hypothetical protein [Nocardioides marmoribigeumensis]MDR7362533.1 uncharacterized protein YukE [Nocardioides marmoribigeumensis]